MPLVLDLNKRSSISKSDVSHILNVPCSLKSRAIQKIKERRTCSEATEKLSDDDSDTDEENCGYQALKAAKRASHNNNNILDSKNVKHYVNSHQDDERYDTKNKVDTIDTLHKRWRSASIKMRSGVHFNCVNDNGNGIKRRRFRRSRTVSRLSIPESVGDGALGVEFASPVLPRYIKTSSHRMDLFDINKARRESWMKATFANDLEKERRIMIARAKALRGEASRDHLPGMHSGKHEKKDTAPITESTEIVQQAHYQSNKDDAWRNAIQKRRGIFELITRGIDAYTMTGGAPTEITPFLFLGDRQDAKNLNRLRQLNITHIINAAALQLRNNYPGHFEYMDVHVLDKEGQDLKRWFSATNAFIAKAKKEKKKVFVHCKAGFSRSPAIVMAYLMKEESIRLRQVIDFVTEKRLVFPNEDFRFQVRERIR